MKKFNQFINENVEESSLKLNVPYFLEKGDVSMIFYLTSIDTDEDAAYMKVVYPGLAYQGVTLTSLLKAGPKELKEDEKKEIMGENEN